MNALTVLLPKRFYFVVLEGRVCFKGALCNFNQQKDDYCLILMP